MPRTDRCPASLVAALTVALMCPLPGVGTASAAPIDYSKESSPGPADAARVDASTPTSTATAPGTPVATVPPEPDTTTEPIPAGADLPAGAVAPAPSDQSAAAIVVKVDIALGHRIDEVVAAHPVEVESAVLASRGIYLLKSTDPRFGPKKAKELANKVSRSRAVVYAEPNYTTQLSDTRFHAWPDGTPVDNGTDTSAWLSQPAATRLQLSQVHARTTGVGQKVAVLDTGVDAHHPALRGRLLAGYDYIDDDPDPADATSGSGAGHGTFVTGIVGLVAPDAKVLPYRVLDRDGKGNAFLVSEAILDATAAGAGVINLSFGVSVKLESRVIAEAIKHARKQGALVVAAAGNDVKAKFEFPAAQSEVLGITALPASRDEVSTFANRSNWVDVAAPGEQIVGPLPGGRFAVWAGTSMATPFVTGQVALLRQAYPGTKSDKVRERIRHSARKLLSKQHVHFGAADLFGSIQGRV